MIRLVFSFFALVFLTGCTSTEQNILTELEKECNCKKVGMSESPGTEYTYVTYHIVDSKNGDIVKESSRLFFHLMEKVKGFCDLDKKIVLRFEDETGKEQNSFVYHKCQIKFEF